MTVKHKKVSTLPDDADTNSVSPTDWNDGHEADLPFEIILENGGSVLATGVYGDIELSFDGVITGWTLLADQTGSLVVDLWKDTYANYPPTDADSITASAPPTISSAIKNTDTTLTGWTTTFTDGDTLRINIDSVTSIVRATLVLRTRTT